MPEPPTPGSGPQPEGQAARAGRMQAPTPEDAAAAQQVIEWALARLTDRAGTLPPVTPWPALPGLTARGAGVEQAMRGLIELVFPTTLPPDHPRFLAFIPGAPSVVSVLADMAVAASGVFGGTRLEGAAAVDAEDAVLRWLADAAGFPEGAGGTFVSGGSIANLSALVAARGDRYADPARQAIVTGASAHSSLAAAGRIMGCEVVAAEPADEYGRLDARTLRAALGDRDPHNVVAVVATAGATNNGAVDDLAGIAGVCEDRGLWLHIDGSYGGAALLSPRTRPLFDGVECADSLTINPHKWLFAPFDCSAIVYRDKAGAASALTQRADYLDAVTEEGGANPADLAIHLTRRARGLPLWASVTAYGTDAYVEAIEASLDVAGYAADAIRDHPRLELVIEPALTVVVFRRRGWTPAEYAEWSDAAIRSGLGVVMPTGHRGETVLRLCFVNPLTTRADVDLVLASFS